MGLVKLEVNNKKIDLDLINFGYKDEKGHLSDSITLQVAGIDYKLPKYQDKIKAYISDFYCGTFFVQNVKIRSNQLTVEATSVDFNGSLNQVKNKSYEATNLTDLIKEIAKDNNIDYKTDFESIKIDNAEQISQTTLKFLTNLSKVYSAFFAIKNEKILFLKEKPKDENLIYVVEIEDCSDYEIEHTNKTLYNSCKVIWQDTKENTKQEVIIGNGEPTKVVTGLFTSEEEAKIHAISALNQANKGIIKGRLTTQGKEIEAEATLNFNNQLFNITNVRHNIDNNKWQIEVEFEN